MSRTIPVAVSGMALTEAEASPALRLADCRAVLAGELPEALREHPRVTRVEPRPPRRSVAPAASYAVETVRSIEQLPIDAALFTFAGPAALFTHLALLSRPAPAAQAGNIGSLEWYPPGRLVAWAAVVAGLLAGILVLALGYDQETYRESIREILSHSALKELDRDGTLLTDENIANLANVLAREGDQIVGHNTDALALEVEFGQLVKTERAIVLGSGGATPAVVAAARAAGIAEVYVSARRFEPATPPDRWPGAAEFQGLGAQLLAWPSASAEARRIFEAVAASAGLVVQCTSAGMTGKDSGEPLAGLVPWSRLPGDALAYDLVYAPLETPFLRVAREAGRRTAHGLNMLVGQAALSVEIWLGRRPALAPLLTAALAELERRKRA